MGASSVLSTKDAINVGGVVACDPLEGLSLPVETKKRICSSFDEYMVPIHECLFTRIGVQLPFYEFEVAFLRYLKVVPSQLHSGSWARIRVFQLCVEHKS